jgi:pilus assembly protein CpaE
MVRLWDRLQIRKAEETLTVVNRHSRGTEIQPSLVEKVTGTRVARAAVPAAFKELQSVVDAGRLQDLDARSAVKQALWALAGELELVADPEHGNGGGRRRKASGGDRNALLLRRKGGDRGSVTLEFAGMFPLILITMAILWQAALYGYTYSLAGNAADEAARAATAAFAVDGDVAGACQAAGAQNLPGAWSDTSIDCAPAGPLMRAEVEANVPLFFPGFDAGWTVSGEAGAALEGDPQ